ncbi:MAG: 6-phosphofructokinase, partial [Clostridiales bacterium]|nr:6-phosphofructokinase [Clostridiales bacterium]
IRLGGIGNVVASQLEELVGLEARATILGHVQRGGTPTANDRILSTRYGSFAVELLMQGKFGNMVILDGSKLSYDSLENVIGQNKSVEESSYWIKTARSIGMCLGD